MSETTKNEAFHNRLALLVGTEEPFRWAKRMGIPSATFARIWNNYDIPKHDHLCRIAQRCAVSLDWLLMGCGESSSSANSFSFVPLIGFASCGIAQGWFNETDLSNRVLLPSFMAEENAFAVLCHGKSMVPAGIENGSLCIVYPNRPVEMGKPVLIRTKSYIKGREVSLTTIKVFDSESEDSIVISGWLDPDETGVQSIFTEERSKKCVVFMAPVGNVLPIEMTDKNLEADSGVDKEALILCLETLYSLYDKLDSQKFARAILFLYERIRQNGSPDMDTLRALIEIISQNPKD